jgi:hypothetical protein
LDPRPARALLQGAYAHLGVTDFWRVHRRRAEADAAKAEFEFAYWRELTARAIATLSRSGELTLVGARFVDGMAATLDQWRTEPVSSAVVDAVRDMADANTVMWRLRNQRPASDLVRQLGRQRAAGDPCAGIDEPVIDPGPPSPARDSPLGDHIRQRLLSKAPAAGATPGDHAYVSGDLATAIAAYLVQIAIDPMTNDAWVGLAAALRGRGDEPAATVLALRPDLVRALYLDGRAEPSAATPEGCAVWLATGLPKLGADVRGSEA